jgi:hypothetical protein
VIWLTWRQHRSEAVVLGCVLVAAAAGLTLARLAMTNAFDQLGLGSCGSLSAGSCQDATSSFIHDFAFLFQVSVFLTLVPGLVGMFIGAPMVAREVDRGTHWLVWSQDVSRGRWLLVKSAGLLLLGALAVGLFTLTLAWALGAFFRVTEPLGPFSGYSPFESFFFDVMGVVPVACAIFALALGMAAGTLLPRTLPAMLVVIFLFGGVRLAVAQARFHYPPSPMTVTEPLTKSSQTSYAGPPVPPGAWMVGHPILVDPHGSPAAAGDPCQKSDRSGQSNCSGYQLLTAYQPADRYWRFQAIESGIYLALSALLLVLTAYWVRRRVI